MQHRLSPKYHVPRDNGAYSHLEASVQGKALKSQIVSRTMNVTVYWIANARLRPNAARLMCRDLSGIFWAIWLSEKTGKIANMPLSRAFSSLDGSNSHHCIGPCTKNQRPAQLSTNPYRMALPQSKPPRAVEHQSQHLQGITRRLRALLSLHSMCLPDQILHYAEGRIRYRVTSFRNGWTQPHIATKKWQNDASPVLRLSYTSHISVVRDQIASNHCLMATKDYSRGWVGAEIHCTEWMWHNPVGPLSLLFGM